MPEPNPEDLVARMRADGDQMRAAMDELTQLLVTFRAGLVEGGFAPDIADGMATAYFGLLLTALAHG